MVTVTVRGMFGGGVQFSSKRGWRVQGRGRVQIPGVWPLGQLVGRDTEGLVGEPHWRPQPIHYYTHTLLVYTPDFLLARRADGAVGGLRWQCPGLLGMRPVVSK